MYVCEELEASRILKQAQRHRTSGKKTKLRIDSVILRIVGEKIAMYLFLIIIYLFSPLVEIQTLGFGLNGYL